MSVDTLKDGRHRVRYPKGTLLHDPNRTTEYFGRGEGGKQKALERDAEIKRIRLDRKQDKLQSPTFADLVTTYLKAKNGVIAKTTMDCLVLKFKAVIGPFFGRIQAHEISHEMLDDYVNMRLNSKKRVFLNKKSGPEWKKTDENIGASTVVRDIADIQAVLNFAVKRKLVPVNPLAHYERPSRDDEIIQPPSVEEVKKIIAASAPHLVRAVMISYYTGLRPGVAELFRLTWNDVNLIKKTILITSAKKGGLTSRDIPITNDAFLEQLAQWRDSDQGAGYIIQYKGRPVKSIKTAWAAAKRRAGIPKDRRLRPYDCRHAFATELLAAGGDLKSVSQMLGHSDVTTTLRKYQHVNMGLLKKTVSNMPDLFGED